MTETRPNTAISTRPAQAADVLTLEKIVNYAYRGGKEVKSWTGEEHLIRGARITAAELTQLMATADKHLLVAVDINGKVLGCIVCETDSADAYIGMLAVDPDVQSGGIGKTLMQAAEALARQMGKKSSAMCVLCGRPELQSWYERLGYMPTGDTSPFPAGEDSRFTMLKPDLHFVSLKKDL